MRMAGHEDQKYHTNQGASRTAMPAMQGDRVTGDNPDELFDLVDERDRVIGQVRRGDAHHNPALLHRSVQVLVFNDAGHLLLQRRSASKDLFPGYYCASASGHLTVGETYASAAAREVHEELGISLGLGTLIERGRGIVRSARETELTAVYTARANGPFTFNPTETAGGAFFAPEAIAQGRADGTLPLTPALLAALDLLTGVEKTGGNEVENSDPGQEASVRQDNASARAGDRPPVDQR